MNRLFSGLWRHPDFMKLWIGQTISEFGSRISRDAIPLTAVIVLAATPMEMAVLVAAASVPVLLLGLFAGAWVDRMRRRPIMIVADVARLVILLTIPFAAMTGGLSMGLLYAAAGLSSVLALFFDLAYRAMLPSLINRDLLLEGNSKLATTDSLAEIGGPALSGLLIQLISAPLAIFFDALSFMFSAASVALIRTAEPPLRVPENSQTIFADIVAGLRLTIGQPILRTLAIGTGLQSFFGNFIGTLYALYAVRELGLSPALLGVVIAAGGVGALVGALSARWLPNRLGLGPVLTGALLVGSLINLLTPLANGPVWVAAGMLIVVQLINDAAMSVYMINEMTLRQMVVPDRMLGRANASIGFIAQGIAPVGAITSGVIAGLMGTRLTLLVAVVGILFTAVWMSTTPLRRLSSQVDLAVSNL